MNWISVKDRLPPNFDVMPFEELTKLSGPLTRHVEQLWDEIKSLKERVRILEDEMDKR